MRFRKSFKIAKGVRLNVGKKGVSSISLGGRGATVNVGSKGVKATSSIRGTGITHTQKVASFGGTKKKQARDQAPPEGSVVLSPGREVGPLLAIGIVITPYIFSWVTLRPGYSAGVRGFSLGWMVLLTYILLSNGNS